MFCLSTVFIIRISQIAEALTLLRTFLCFMKAHLLLDQGNEDPDEPDIINQKKAWGRPIAHFDLKAANGELNPFQATKRDSTNEP
jgi:hypothetical protein